MSWAAVQNDDAKQGSCLKREGSAKRECGLPKKSPNLEIKRRVRKNEDAKVGPSAGWNVPPGNPRKH